MRVLKCTSCKLLDLDKNIKDFVCPAFPEGIPDEIRLDETLQPSDKPCNPKLNQVHWEKK